MRSAFFKFGVAAAFSLVLFSASEAQTQTTTSKKERSGSTTSTSSSTATTTSKKTKAGTAETKLLKKIDARLKLTTEQERQVLQMIQTSNTEWSSTTTTTTMKKGSSDYKTALNTSAEKLEANIKGILTTAQLARYTKYQSAIRKDLGWKALAKK